MVVMARIRLDGVTKSYGAVTALGGSRSRSATASSWCSSVPPAAARPRRSTSSPASSRSRRARSGSTSERVTLIPPHKREVAMVFQSYALYPQKTVFENIAFGLRLRGAARAEIERKVKARRRRARDRPPAGAPPAPALGWPAPACRARPRAGAPADRVPDGRAAVEPRRRPARLHAHADQEAAPLDGHDLRLRHPRPGRGAHARRPHHRDANGVVQQVDTPDGIYNRPRNRFVAGFLGSPQMNFVDGELFCDGADGAGFARGELAHCARPGAHARAGRAQGGARAARRGHRAGAAGGGRPGLSGVAALVSPLGSEQHVNVAVGDVELIVRVPKEARIAVGDRVELALDPRRLHLFDAATDESLTRDA